MPQAQWRGWRIWRMGRSWESWDCLVWRRNSSRASYLPLQIPDEDERDGDRLFSVVHRARIRDNGHKLKHERLLLYFLKYFCYEWMHRMAREFFCLHSQNPPGPSPEDPAHISTLEWTREARSSSAARKLIIAGCWVLFEAEVVTNLLLKIQYPFLPKRSLW